MASVTRYHEYLWALVAPWLGQRVMEIGVGYGQYTRKMLAESRSVLACEASIAATWTNWLCPFPGRALKILYLDLENPEPQPGFHAPRLRPTASCSLMFLSIYAGTRRRSPFYGRSPSRVR